MKLTPKRAVLCLLVMPFWFCGGMALLFGIIWVLNNPYFQAALTVVVTIGIGFFMTWTAIFEDRPEPKPEVIIEPPKPLWTIAKRQHKLLIIFFLFLDSSAHAQTTVKQCVKGTLFVSSSADCQNCVYDCAGTVCPPAVICPVPLPCPSCETDPFWFEQWSACKETLAQVNWSWTLTERTLTACEGRVRRLKRAAK